MRFACEELKLVVEPGGAVALAALLARKIALDGKTAKLARAASPVDTVRLVSCRFSDSSKR
jgi:threonine dehydratase